MERFKLAEILSERARIRFGLSPYPSHLVRLLSLCSLDDGQADRLVWGEQITLNLSQVETIAAVFDLDTELLACLLTPVSFEGVDHAADMKVSRLDQECHECYLIREARGRGAVILHALLHHLGHDGVCSASLPVELASMRVINLLDKTGPAPIGEVSDICQVDEEAILWLGQKMADLSGRSDAFSFDAETGIVGIDIETRQV